MHCLLVSEIFPPAVGGSGRWFWEVYRRLPRENCVIAAGTHSRQKHFDLGHDLDVHRVIGHPGNWEWIGWRGADAYVRAIGNVLRLVKSRNIEMIHCGRMLPEGVIANVVKSLTGVPFCCYAHGEEVTGAKVSREHTLLVKRVLRRCEFIIANSKNTARLLQQEWEFPAERTKILHPGVDTERFRPAEVSTEVRELLGWQNRPVILTVGRLQGRKGHDKMIEALGKIRAAIPNVLYAIVGDGEERARLEAVVDKLDLRSHVRFHGENGEDELLYCYQQCDLFVLPNRQIGQDIEGFGMVLVEAQACGKPVLAGDSGGTAETMKVGETGFVVDCTSVDGIANAVADLLEDDSRRIEMGIAARRWVVRQFDWSSLSENAAALFENHHPQV